MLYQPLTLLDCLHTFCGSCLKEWFSWQATQASSQKPNPFTCPSCRASVRDTKPNAGITTLLDMFLLANPSRGRSEEEKNELRRNYDGSEAVIPKIRRKKESSDEAEDRRLVDEVREMSLRDVGIGASVSNENEVRHRIRNSVRGRRGDSTRHRSRQQSENDGEADARPSTASDAVSRTRQIEHQSSLRSLLSASDGDSTEVEEEILKQIMDEGILDGIDLNNIDVSQEDELCERIADAYRRRHHLQASTHHHRQPSSPSPARDQRAVQPRQNRRPSRSPNPPEQAAHSSHPPVSRPHLLEAYPSDRGHRRRTSSESRRQTSPIPPSSGRRTSSETQRQAARSATDLSPRPENPSTGRTRPRDPSIGERRTTDPTRSHQRRSSRERAPASRTQSGLSREPPPNHIANVVSSTTPLPERPSLDSRTSSSRATHGATNPVVHQSRNTTSVIRNPPTLLPDAAVSEEIFTEPSITCDRCEKKGIEYDLHWNCAHCHEGKYNLCLNCYRNGRGCSHWSGFGHAPIQRYYDRLPAVDGRTEEPPPHQLESHRYLRPPANSLRPVTPNSRTKSTSDPKKRLQSGPFCSNCSKFTPKCYWICDICNDGEWGYCNFCVNQGKCCTHALLPISLDSTSSDALQSPISSQHTSIQPSISSPSLPTPFHTLGPSWAEKSVPLTFNTKCDVCTYPIPPSTTRFHCPQCNSGDYDIDSTCYHRLAHNGKISVENGPKGWRRCPNGHRMVIIGFEDSDSGQRRIVVEDLVGGKAFKDDINAENKTYFSWPEGHERLEKTVERKSTMAKGAPVTEVSASGGAPSSLLKRFPPNGGVGMHVLALWAWWPDDGDESGLGFGFRMGED